MTINIIKFDKNNNDNLGKPIVKINIDSVFSSTHNNGLIPLRVMHIISYGLGKPLLARPEEQ